MDPGSPAWPAVSLEASGTHPPGMADRIPHPGRPCRECWVLGLSQVQAPVLGQLTAQILEAKVSHQKLGPGWTTVSSAEPDWPTQVRSRPCPLQASGPAFYFKASRGTAAAGSLSVCLRSRPHRGGLDGWAC